MTKRFLVTVQTGQPTIGDRETAKMGQRLSLEGLELARMTRNVPEGVELTVAVDASDGEAAGEMVAAALPTCVPGTSARVTGWAAWADVRLQSG